jgi:hypothetical protein
MATTDKSGYPDRGLPFVLTRRSDEALQYLAANHRDHVHISINP